MRSMYWVRDLIKIEFKTEQDENSKEEIKNETVLDSINVSREMLETISANTITQNSLFITGDVENELILNDYTALTTHKITIENKEISAVSPLEVIKLSQPYNSNSDIIFYSNDGVMAQININELLETSLIRSEENGWQLIAPNHSPQAGMRQIAKIIVVSNEILENQPHLLIDTGIETIKISYGSLFKENTVVRSVLEGTAQKFEYTVGAYTRREIIPISNYVTENQIIFAEFSDGTKMQIEQTGYIEWRGNTADYIAPDEKTRTVGIQKILVE